jgi:hypothetical protein
MLPPSARPKMTRAERAAFNKYRAELNSMDSAIGLPQIPTSKRTEAKARRRK